MSGLPKRFADRAEIAAVRAEAERFEAGAEGENTYRLAGRVMARRDLGKLVFLDLVAVGKALRRHGVVTIAQARGPSFGVSHSVTTLNPLRS